jgi:hypothetical protein
LASSAPDRFALALALALVAGCSRDAERPVPAAASPAPPSPLPSPPAPAPASLRGASARSPGCRVMSVSGSALHGAMAARAGDKYDDREPIELRAGAVLRLMHTASTRQWTITGPARLVACAGGDEELVLARGTVRTEAGAGARPGAEVWVGTPYGSLRYADARAELIVDAAALEVRVVSGPLWFTPLGGDSVEDGAAPERALSEASQSFAAHPYRPNQELATGRCARAATLAAARAEALLAPSAEPLGARAAEHVRARQRAHALCASAFASVLDGERAPIVDGSRAWLAQFDRYDRLWRAVPSAPIAARRP